jgi:glycosyltransferase involved in cell wall biosynthesis
MRILQLVRDMHPRAGGPPRVVAGSSTALAERGHEVSIAAICSPEDEAAVHAAWPGLARAGVSLRLFPPSAPAFLGASRSLARATRADAGGYDLLHMHGVWDGCLVDGGRAARRAGRPYFISPHGMLDHWSIAQSTFKKQAWLALAGGNRFLSGASGLVFGTTDEASEAGRFGPEVPRVIVPNGVDVAMVTERDRSAVDRLRREVPEARNWSRTILFYSRLHPKKNIDGLIGAFASLAEAFPDAGLLVAGIASDPDYETHVRAMAAQPVLAGRVAITTALMGPESRFVLDAADLFALPSHQEGFSMAIIEAMARRVPVLISDRCHMPEVAAAGAGEVVATTDLAQGLRKLLARGADELRSMGERGNRLVAEYYAWPVIAGRLETAYARAVR